jgi:hypothetical protein
MIDRLILSAVLGTVGWHGLFPDPPQPITPWQLQQKAKEKSLSGMCDRKPAKRARKQQKICVDDGGNIMLKQFLNNWREANDKENFNRIKSP